MAEGNSPRPFDENRFTKFVDGGNLSSIAADWKSAMSQIFTNLAYTEETVCGRFTYYGQWMFMAFKYSAGNYGQMIAIGIDGSSYIMIRFNNNDTFYSITKTVVQ